jgi:transcriptional regulator with XRE-family HTH domain
LIAKLLNSQDFRDAYVFEHLKTGIAYQSRAMRDECGWTQSKLGEEAGKPRNVITRIEDPNYGQLSLQTLREIASAFHVALLVKFVPFSRLLEEYDDVSPRALIAASVNDKKEIRRLKRWAAEKDRAQRSEDAKETPVRTLRLETSNVAGADMLFLDIQRKGRHSRKAKSEREGQPAIETVTINALPFRFGYPISAQGVMYD